MKRHRSHSNDRQVLRHRAPKGEDGVRRISVELDRVEPVVEEKPCEPFDGVFSFAVRDRSFYKLHPVRFR